MARRPAALGKSDTHLATACSSIATADVSSDFRMPFNNNTFNKDTVCVYDCVGGL